MTAPRPAGRRKLDREHRRGLPGPPWLAVLLLLGALLTLCPVFALVRAVAIEGDRTTAARWNYFTQDTSLELKGDRIVTVQSVLPTQHGGMSISRTYVTWGDFYRPSRERWTCKLTDLSPGNLPGEAAGALARLKEDLLAGRPVPGIELGPPMAGLPTDLSRPVVEVRHWGNTLMNGLRDSAGYLALIVLLGCVLCGCMILRSARILGPARWRRGECPVCRYAIPTPVPYCPECGLALPAFVVVSVGAPEPYLEAMVKGRRRA